MDLKEFIKEAEKAGYKLLGHYPVYNATLLHKRLSVEVTGKYPCLTNDHKISFEIRSHDPVKIRDHVHVSVSLHIIGEYDAGDWCELNIYSKKPNELIEGLEEYENCLADAWVAMASRRKKEKDDV